MTAKRSHSSAMPRGRSSWPSLTTALEAVLGTVYLEGGLETVRAVVARLEAVVR